MTNKTIFQEDAKQVFHSPLFTVEETKFLTPNGNQKTHYIVNRLPTVDIFPITDNYEICLVREYRKFFDKKIIAAASGFMDKDNETPLQAAKRELQEELGIHASQWEELAKVELGSSVIKGTEFLFLAKDLEFGKSRPEEDEDISLVRIPLHKAVEKVFTGEIFISSSIIGILLLNTLKKEGKL